MTNKERQAAKYEKKQQKMDAGLMSELFPEVAGVVIEMEYKQKGIRDFVPRTVNFYPGSYAFFRVDCLNKDCLEGGFDFTGIMHSMVRSRSRMSRGKLDCEEGAAISHSSISYMVTIQYV